MPSQNLIKMLNEQINLEFFSSNLYLQMGAWAETQGLRGAAFFLHKHADEEMMHMKKLWSYVNSTGTMATVGKIDAPETKYASIESLFSYILEHEHLVTKRINELVDAALSEKDYATFNFLQWYVAEQREEETLFGDILDKIKLLGGDQRGLFFVDREIASMGAQA